MQTNSTEKAERFDHSSAAEWNDPIARRSLAQRKLEFNKTCSDWIEAQSRDFAENGLWCEGLVSWQTSETKAGASSMGSDPAQ